MSAHFIHRAENKVIEEIQMRAVVPSTPTMTGILGDGYQTFHDHSLPLECPAPRAVLRAPVQRYVDHTYRDFSNFPLEELPTQKKPANNFPSKLHQILSNPEYAHVR